MIIPNGTRRLQYRGNKHKTQLRNREGGGVKVKKEDLITLKILPEEHGYSIYLDDKKLHHVEG